ncbi:aspartate aminotransferase [Clostridia bacterium]|nr:aspartate aminotransferase [Clostridia bacterium]
MIAKQMSEDILGGSAIRAMFLEGKELADRIGSENVYDFSLGNPAAEVPPPYTKALEEVLKTEDPVSLHGYMDNAGYPAVRAAIAKHLNNRFGTDVMRDSIVNTRFGTDVMGDSIANARFGTVFTENHILMTVGAAGAINVILKTLLDPGDEVAVFAPYFTEYRNYCRNWQGVLTEVLPEPESFLPDLADMEQKITKKTKAVIINNPVNPTGVVYGEETIVAITALLLGKQEEYGHAIYLISDEPYRELVYDGRKVPFLPHYYANTFVSYSFSKSLSVPGDRIGYIALSPEMENEKQVFAGLSIANRVIGFVNAPALMQKAVAQVLEEHTDVAFYDRNRRLLYDSLKGYGFTCVKPEGAFYLFVKSPDADTKKFIEKAKIYHILLVDGAAFSGAGYVRIAYCVPFERIQKSLSGFCALAREYQLS